MSDVYADARGWLESAPSLAVGRRHVMALLTELDRARSEVADLREMHAEHIDALRQERDNLRYGMIAPLNARLDVCESMKQGWEDAHADRLAERDAAHAALLQVREEATEVINYGGMSAVELANSVVFIVDEVLS
ncbi:hypothetical protein JTZ10_21500 [Gordonia rubripertincta]|uniref:Flagellar protein FlgN n=1 Tax=Gordonia rubripertincta TaxID=36822 RepID=A0AAW4GAJ4_GORRU|nr:hypothetical protein [Gordonia rubripertincta]MBM7280323.1 hypothetical protein [Gordonia rubripertincta]